MFVFDCMYVFIYVCVCIRVYLCSSSSSSSSGSGSGSSGCCYHSNSEIMTTMVIVTTYDDSNGRAATLISHTAHG